MTERRDDVELVDRLERGIAPRSEDETAARAPYQRLIERIGELDVVEPPSGWLERAVDRWERERVAAPAPVPVRARRWKTWIGAVMFVVAAAIALVLVLEHGDHAPAPDGVTVRRDGRVRDHGAAVSDTIVAPVPARGEVRLYRDRMMVARCPGVAPTCSARALAFVIDRPGGYQVVTITSAAAPPPGDRGLEKDLLELDRARATYALEAVIDAR